MRCRSLLLAALLGLLLAGAPAAQALPVLEEADAAELAQSLADATEAQGVCYGWAVSVLDGSGGPSGDDVGSDRGPGQVVDRGSCAKWVELRGAVEFTCDSCESEDDSAVQLESNFAGAPTRADLEDLGLSGGDLKNDDNDTVLSNMVGALPLITASNGAAKPVPGLDAAEADMPAAGDVPTGTPSTPDWLRDNWLALVFFALLGGGGAWWLLRLRRAEAWNQSSGFSPAAPVSSAPASSAPVSPATPTTPVTPPEK